MADFDPAPAAELLAAAWRSDAQMAELPAAVRPRTLRKGDVVSTGTVSAPFDLGRAADLVATAEGTELGFRLVMTP